MCWRSRPGVGSLVDSDGHGPQIAHQVGEAPAADGGHEAVVREGVPLAARSPATSAGIGWCSGGIDVDSSEAVAQVKAKVKPVGRPVIQQTAGIAAADHKAALVF